MYKSPAQQARVLTESWVGSRIFCPSCGRDSLNRHANNTPVGDFFCSGCNEQFELKAKRSAFGIKIVDGEYHTMVRRLQSNQVPSLFGLRYDREHGRVRDLFVIPSQFFVPSIIECRKPLALTARRAGWIGCNILINKVPLSGRVSIVSNGVVLAKPDVLKAWRRTLFLRAQPQFEKRGWTLDVMKCIERLGKPEFQLSDVYAEEATLAQRYPENRHIQAKIRQQLQVLRDAGYLEFLGCGRYRVQ
jgi:type II restriction enzyme